MSFPSISGGMKTKAAAQARQDAKRRRRSFCKKALLTREIDKNASETRVDRLAARRTMTTHRWSWMTGRASVGRRP